MAEHLQRTTVDCRAGDGLECMSQSSGIFSPPAMVSSALSTSGSMLSLRDCTEPSSIPTLATPGCLLRMHLVEKSLILMLISLNFRSSGFIQGMPDSAISTRPIVRDGPSVTSWMRTEFGPAEMVPLPTTIT